MIQYPSSFNSLLYAVSLSQCGQRFSIQVSKRTISGKKTAFLQMTCGTVSLVPSFKHIETEKFQRVLVPIVLGDKLTHGFARRASIGEVRVPFLSKSRFSS